MLFKNYEQIISNGQTSKLKKSRKDILDIFTAAANSVNPYNCVKKVFKKDKIVFESEEIVLTSFKNIYVVGFGKACVGMADAVCDFSDVKSGVIITNDSSSKIKYDYIEVVVGGHPIPNNDSIVGTKKILDLINSCDEDDLLIILISGGGSSLLCDPKVSLEDLQVTTDLLLRSGADIKEINTIRKHLSYVKGGQLVKKAKCSVISLIISDIVDDPLEFIASGPTIADSTTYKDAKDLLEKYDLWNIIRNDVKNIINKGVFGKIDETLKGNDPVFNHVFNFIVANNKIACEGAMKKAIEIGYNSLILTTSLKGEAKDVGKFIVKKANNYKKDDSKKFALIAGGETTVTIKGDGRGGRNQEMVLGVVEYIADKNILFASFATDGIDGKSDASGAIADTFSFNRAKKMDLDVKIFLEENNSYEFFKKLDDLFFTGKTGTNVMDIQLTLTY